MSIDLHTDRRGTMWKFSVIGEGLASEFNQFEVWAKNNLPERYLLDTRFVPGRNQTDLELYTNDSETFIKGRVFIAALKKAKNGKISFATALAESIKEGYPTTGERGVEIINNDPRGPNFAASVLANQHSPARDRKKAASGKITVIVNGVQRTHTFEYATQAEIDALGKTFHVQCVDLETKSRDAREGMEPDQIREGIRRLFNNFQTSNFYHGETAVKALRTKIIRGLQQLPEATVAQMVADITFEDFLSPKAIGFGKSMQDVTEFATFLNSELNIS